MTRGNSPKLNLLAPDYQILGYPGIWGVAETFPSYVTIQTTLVQ